MKRTVYLLLTPFAITAIAACAVEPPPPPAATSAKTMSAPEAQPRPPPILRPGAAQIPFGESAAVTARGLSCHLAVLGHDTTGARVRVTLRNEGSAAFEHRHGHTGIRFNLILEIYDADKKLVRQVDTLSYFSPYAPGDVEIMRIPPGGEVSDELNLGAAWTELASLPPGRLFLRVAFPFEEGTFSPSELVELRR